jgi:RNA polymerase sigma-70 factor (ECF subfamily)
MSAKMMSSDQIRAQVLVELPRLRRFAIALTGSVADGDDLVQDTVDRALRNLHRWEPGTQMDRWLFRIARNRFIDGKRAAKRQNLVPMETAESLAVTSSDGARALEARMELHAVDAALQTLPDEQREALALVLIDGMPYRQAADLLGIPIGTLTSRIGRARQSLALALGV